MPQLVAALFETRDQAEQALAALIAAGTAPDRVRIVGEEADHGGDGLSETRDGSAGTACAAALQGLRLPEEDASAFAAACGGGGAVLAADVDEAALDEAVQVIEAFDPIDLDSRTEQRLAQGGEAADADGPLATGLSAGGLGGETNTGAPHGMGAMTDRVDDLRSGDLRAPDLRSSEIGLSSTKATGARNGGERADESELGAEPDRFRRQPNRVGRVRAYVGQ